MRGSVFTTKQIRHLVSEWLKYQSRDDHQQHQRQRLLATSDKLMEAIDRIVDCFQERVQLKSSKKTTGNKRGWNNKLLSMVYGDKLQKRKAITTAEAKLLPFLSHERDVLQAFLDDQRQIHQLSTTETYEDLRVRWTFKSWPSLEDAIDPTDLEEWNSMPLHFEEKEEEEEETEDEGSSTSEEEDHEMESTDGFVAQRSRNATDREENEALGFPSVVIQYKKQSASTK